MTTKDVLALALEALEQLVIERTHEAMEAGNEAITAIKQAQQAQEPVERVYDAIEECLLNHRLHNFMGDDGDHYPLVDHLSHGNSIEGGQHEIRLICDSIYNTVLKPTHPAPKQAEPSCRIELVGAIHTLASHYENRLHRLDPEDRKLAEGDIAHAMRVAAKWNWNGTSPTPPEAK